LYDRPANVFVAGFIGSPSMNFLNATATEAHTVTINGAAPVTVQNVAFAPGKALTFGIRPENLTITSAGDGMAAKVEVVEPTGADTQVFCKVGDNQDIVVMLRDRIVAAPGDTIWIKPDASKIHLFDAETGKRTN
jgi:multiple sugar transport system ATP-binding protein